MRAIFLDRDGTINADYGYVHRIEDFHFLPNSIEALKLLSTLKSKLVIITSQSGIARGQYTEGDLHRLHEHILKELAKEGVHIDGFYYCPHHPTQGIGSYKVVCDCRKPKIGMILQAKRDLGIDLPSSFAVGDKPVDVEMGKNAGMPSIQVKGKYGISPLADYVAEDLLDAARYIVKRISEN